MITSFNLGGGGGGESSKVFRFNFPRGSWVKDDELAESVREHYRNGETVIGIDYYGKEYIVSEVNADGTYFEFVNIYKATSDHKVYVNSYILWSSNIFGQETTRTLAQYDDLNGKVNVSDYLQLRDRVEEIELFSTPNVTIVGNPTIKSGQVSGFNADNYLKFPYLVHLHDRTFSINFCITTSNDIINQQNILDSEFGLAVAIRNSRFVLAMGSDGSTWDMGEHIGTNTIEANTTYHVKLSWDKSTYKLEFGDTMDDSGDVVYNLDIVVNDTKSLAAKEMFIGVGSDLTHIFGGSLNLNHCYLIIDGKVVWNGINGNLSTDLSNIDDDGKDVVKALAKQAQILWYGTQEQYDVLVDKTQFNIYLISE